MPNDSPRSKRSERAALQAELALIEAEIAERTELARRTAERLAAERVERLATAGLLDFVPLVSPQYIAPEHLAPALEVFERIARGERVRACISIPPQHGKTETVLHALAWLLRRRPDWTLAFATYQQEQADDKSHAARDIARRAGVDLSADRANLRFWRTDKRGGCLFTAVGGPFTGQGVRAAIVDDPYKGRSEALSDATRKHVERWFSSVVLQRGQEDLSVVVIHTRWCEDDLIGRIAAGAFGDGWHIVNLPLLALDDGTPAPRPYDRAARVLNPRRTMPNGDTFGWSLDGAVRHLLALPEADAESLAQGRPRARVDGALWSWAHITPWRVATEPPRSRCEVFVDPNASADAVAAKADDAGIVTISRGIDGRAYVLDDTSGHVGVDGWPARAVASYRKHQAHGIVAESDGGGAMVEKTIRAWLLAEAQEKGRLSGRHVEAERIPVRLVRVGARGDKRGRAETARHLYGDPSVGGASSVSHVGHHARLEASMTSHDFATTSRSPGDLDALSLGLAELMLTDAAPREATEEHYDF